MKPFVKAASGAARPKIVEASYRVVRDAAADAPQPVPLTPAGSFAELAAKAYRQSRSAGVDRRMDSVA